MPYWCYATYRFIACIPAGVRNIVRWVPVVWSDTDYDYEPLLQMMREKLDSMEGAIRANGYGVAHIQDADNMRVCVLLLDRIIADEYPIEAFRRDQRGNDTKYLFELMGKHVLTWWD